MSCLDFIYSIYEDLYGKKPSTLASQPSFSVGKSIKIKLFSGLLLAQKIKTSHTSFNEIHYYINRVGLLQLTKRYIRILIFCHGEI